MLFFIRSAYLGLYNGRRIILLRNFNWAFLLYNLIANESDYNIKSWFIGFKSDLGLQILNISGGWIEHKNKVWEHGCQCLYNERRCRVASKSASCLEFPGFKSWPESRR
jgi:hypothetical protein